MSRSQVARKMLNVAHTQSVEIAHRLGEVLRARYGDLRSGAKRLGRLIDADPRAVKNWLQGTNAPQLSHVIELMAADPVVEAEILDLVRGRREARCQALSSSSVSAGTALDSDRPAV